MVYLLGETLQETTIEQVLEQQAPALFITSSRKCRNLLKRLEISYEGEINLKQVNFCKAETQQDCLYGSFYIPRILDVLGTRYKMLFFINKNYVVIANDDGFADRMVQGIRRRKIHQGESKEKFLYNFTGEFMNRDMVLLDEYEREIMALEDQVMHGKTQDFQNDLMPLRKKLLTLRSYYDQIADMGKEFEDNENGFFEKKQLKYFGTMIDRADRLMNKTIHFLEYAQQVKDACQAQIENRQNNNMQFLTIISTIFFPLTLITGWYGMNFENMPELKNGYPAIIILSLLVLASCIFIFKKKKLL